MPDKNHKKTFKVARSSAKLFESKGYLETNMADIAKAARLSKGGIYHYFSSKDQILFFILDHYMDIILQDLESDLTRIEDPSSRIKYIISRHIKLYTDYKSESKTLLHEANCLPSKKYRIIAEKERKYYKIVAKTLTEFFGSRVEIGKAQITVITFLLFGMCNWIYSWYDPNGEVTPNQLAETIWSLFLKGLAFDAQVV